MLFRWKVSIGVPRKKMQEVLYCIYVATLRYEVIKLQ